jgi:hypothetical protein
MTRGPQRLGDYLGHILEAIEQIEEYVLDMDEMTFLGSKLAQDAVIRNFDTVNFLVCMLKFKTHGKILFEACAGKHHPVRVKCRPGSFEMSSRAL